MFKGILGNDSLKETLLRLRSGGRFPNAVLFAGPSGVGKRLFALDIGRSLVCRTEVNGSACGECPACIRAVQFEFPKVDDKDAHQKVIRSGHADVGMIVPYKRNILVNAIRDLEAEANFLPYEGRGRVFIIDDADKMNANASNALLKTLEEPSPTTHLILITSRPETLLPTIHSRCQTFRFAPVDVREIARHLAETKGFDPADADLAARTSQGSVGTAMELDLSELKSKRKGLVDVLHAALIDHERSELLRASEKMNEAKNKESFESDLELLLTLVHDVWTLSLGGPSADIVHSDVAGQLTALANSAEPNKLAEIMGEIEQFREGMLVNLNRKIQTDDLFMKMAA